MYGVIVAVNEDRRFGQIRTADSRSLIFVFRHYRGPGETPEYPQPVEFEEQPHPQGQGRFHAVKVRPATGLETSRGTIDAIRGNYGFIRLRNGRSAYFSLPCVALDDLREGEEIECAVVPGRDDRLFTMSIERRVDEHSTVGGIWEAPPEIGVLSLRGRRAGKSINDDAFLVEPLSDDMWLVAVADGVSKPPNGWWASDKCIELLWRSCHERGAQLADVTDPTQDTKIMVEWMNELHEQFIAERRRQLLADYWSATTTLTFAVTRRNRVLYSNSGDTPIYRFDHTKKKLTKIIDALSIARDSKSGLTQHMAAGKKDWQPNTGDAPLAHGDLLVICSDGVVAGEASRQKAVGESATPKFDLLNTTLGDQSRDLQQRVADVLPRIATFENDDLTLVAIQI